MAAGSEFPKRIPGLTDMPTGMKKERGPVTALVEARDRRSVSMMAAL